RSDYARALAFESLILHGDFEFKKEVMLSVVEFVEDKQLRSQSLVNIVEKQPSLSNENIRKIISNSPKSTFESMVYKQFFEKLESKVDFIPIEATSSKPLDVISNEVFEDVDKTLRKLQLIGDEEETFSVIPSILLEYACCESSQYQKEKIL